MIILTPKLEAANLSLADTAVDAVVCAQKALMLASSVLITAGTPGHMYFVDKQEKCLEKNKMENINNGVYLFPAH